MTMAKFKKLAMSVGLILGVLVADQKFGISAKIKSTLGL